MNSGFQQFPPIANVEEILKTIQEVVKLPESEEKTNLLRSLADGLQFVLHPAFLVSKDDPVFRSLKENGSLRPGDIRYVDLS